MACAVIDVLKVQDKFRGCLIGALMGDCMGSAFEGENFVDPDKLRGHLNRTEKYEADNYSLQETDDTQMTQELADSLIKCPEFNPEDLARRFTTRYYSNTEEKGYGGNVIEVFRKLRDAGFKDPYGPATEQFGGTGSLGNGASMRVAPVAMVTLHSAEGCADLADQQARITHTHEDATDGAVFQALAVRRCLLESVSDYDTYLKALGNDLKGVVTKKYMDKLTVIESFLDREDVLHGEVVRSLGNGVAAARSVPTALFCFLRALRPIGQIKSPDIMRRTIEYAISLGGDTDTIASMAGALAGANLGLSELNPIMWQNCPEFNRTLETADQLFKIYERSNPDVDLER